jgi:hypothetical protein
MSSPYTFKLVYTSMVYKYDIDITESSENIYNQLSDAVVADFHLDNNNFEIVLAGQDLREDAYAIPKTSQSFELFLDSHNCSFYIRPTRRNNRININSIVNSCPICLTDNIRVHTYYSCSHFLCSLCNNNWRQTEQTNHNRCPICRSN